MYPERSLFSCVTESAPSFSLCGKNKSAPVEPSPSKIDFERGRGASLQHTLSRKQQQAVIKSYIT